MLHVPTKYGWAMLLTFVSMIRSSIFVLLLTCLPEKWLPTESVNLIAPSWSRALFRAAYENRKPTNPLTFHTDRGTNYRAKTFCAYLKSLGVTQSFSRARVPYDNSVMESFFSSLKREELYRTKYRSENEFRTAVDKYMTFYNEERPHATNQYKTPVQKEADFFSDHVGAGVD